MVGTTTRADWEVEKVVETPQKESDGVEIKECADAPSMKNYCISSEIPKA